MNRPLEHISRSPFEPLGLVELLRLRVTSKLHENVHHDQRQVAPEQNALFPFVFAALHLLLDRAEVHGVQDAYTSGGAAA